MSTYRYNFNYKQPEESYLITLKEACNLADINCRLTGGPEIAWLIDETTELNFKTKTMNIIGLKKYKDANKTEKAMRIIEIMAFGFFNYGARETISGKNIFYP